MNTGKKQTRQTILRLLNNLGDPKEVRQYLKRYSDLDVERFAVVKVGGATLQSQLNALSSSLAFLQEVGLTPIVIHGGGPQLNQALKDQGISTTKHDGIRVTTPQVLKVARQVFTRENQKLTQALKDAGTEATSFVGGVFEARLLDQEVYGLVGQVESVDLDPILNALSNNSIPVISSLAETEAGQILNVNADVATNAIVQAVRPTKIIFLTDTGGILDAKGKVISSINLQTDYDTLMQQDWLHSGMRLKLEQIQHLLSDLPHASSVSVTHPEKLAKELFTYRGSGTLVRMGEAITSHASWSDINTSALVNLVETSFNRKLHPNYIENTHVDRVFVCDSYRAAAIIVNDSGFARMDKFAVTEEAQGEGLGGAVWEQVRKTYKKLYWRSRIDNPINQFYFKHADGAVKHNGWMVFWYGMQTLDHIPDLVNQAACHEESLL
ncbi:MAG: acetylglutamate kinase [Pseudomonadota bacterium]